MSADDRTARQRRHTVARWRGPLPLRWRLLLLVAAGVTMLVFGLTWLQVRAMQRAIETELTDTGRLTAQAVADDLELAGSIDAADISRTLHDFLAADTALRTIAVFTAGGSPIQVASTESAESASARDLAATVIRTGEPLVVGRGSLLYVGHPVQRDAAPLAVIVTVSLTAAERAGRHGLPIAMTFAAATLILLLTLIDAITRRFVHAPLAEIAQTMHRVAAGDWGARAAVLREDELGVVASGLNDMVRRLEVFHRDLQERIDEATAQLRLRNQALEESYERVLALREALGRAERLAAVGQMAAAVAHEVGTPLNLVSGYVQMLREDERADARARERLAIIDDQVRRVTSVLRTLLDHARHPVPRVPVSMREIVERACDIARPALARAGVTLDLSIGRDLPQVVADATQIELALLTLLNNAHDAMPGGGRVTIDIRPAPGGIAIEVRDTGGGIAPEILPRLFEPWVTNKPVGRGTGLGLSIVRDIVREHRGTIAASNVPGEGAAFVIELPAAESPATSAGVRAHAADSDC